MKTTIINPPHALAAFVRNITVVESDADDISTSLPFYADGCPGIMFQQTNGLYLKTADKILPELFLYGQTVKPIELFIEGSFKLVIVYLYPYVTKTLFDINSNNLTDSCFDLSQLYTSLLSSVKEKHTTTEQVISITDFLVNLINTNKSSINKDIQFAIDEIICSKGNASVKEIREKLSIAERTFERLFTTYVGISPKLFSRITQFQFSMKQLHEESYSSLADIGYENGYTDQSHFIRTFKEFTGRTPLSFQKNQKRNNP